jgi:hypothetical protein
LAFPVTNPETKQVDAVLYFIDADLKMEELKKLLPEGQAVDRHMYLQYLEKEYGKRMISEHGEEAGFFGSMDPLSLMPNVDRE